MVKREVKPWYKSKTIWFNVLTGLGAALTGVVGLMPTLQPLITPTSYAISLFVMGTINVGLRVVTKHGLSTKA